MFQNLAVQKLTETTEKMLVAPLRFKSVLLDEMDRVINAAKLGRPASMILKNNSISDRDIILKLEEASCAGVRIDMIVRGICCVRAEVPGKTENLHIRSLVGRYLEPVSYTHLFVRFHVSQDPNGVLAKHGIPMDKTCLLYTSGKRYL